MADVGLLVGPEGLACALPESLLFRRSCPSRSASHELTGPDDVIRYGEKHVVENENIIDEGKGDFLWNAVPQGDAFAFCGKSRSVVRFLGSDHQVQ
jgi:hypothetical protein